MPITLLQPFNLDTTAAYTMVELTVTGNVTGGNLITSGLATATGNLNTSAGVLATGNIKGGNLLTVGLISATGSLSIGTDFNMSGNIIDTGVLWVNTSANGNINLNPNGTGQTNIPTGNLSVTGNVTGGNILTGGLISATGRIFAASGAAGTPGITFSADTAQDTGFYWISDGNIGVSTNGTLRATFLTTGLSVVGNVTGGNIITAGLTTATGNLNTSAGVLATGNIRGGNLISAGTITTAGNIVSSAANAVANIGSATTYFNTVHARSTSALYADVAEYYTSDCFYEPGTVVVFGGRAEVTMAINANDNAVAGVVSTNPAYVMNAGIQSECSVPVALTGRVPTKVIGPVAKGNMMVSAGNGYAQASATPAIGTVIGKAVENFKGTEGIIEIVVGRL